MPPSSSATRRVTVLAARLPNRFSARELDLRDVFAGGLAKRAYGRGRSPRRTSRPSCASLVRMIASIVPCLSSAASSSIIFTIARHGQLAGEPPDLGALLRGQRQRLPAVDLALVHFDPFEGPSANTARCARASRRRAYEWLSWSKPLWERKRHVARGRRDSARHVVVHAEKPGEGLRLLFGRPGREGVLRSEASSSETHCRGVRWRVAAVLWAETSQGSSPTPFPLQGAALISAEWRGRANLDQRRN